MKSLFAIILLLVATDLFSQAAGDDWRDTTYIPSDLVRTLPGRKVVRIQIGDKATLFLSGEVLRDSAAASLSFESPKSKIIALYDSKAGMGDTIDMNQYMDGLDYLIAGQLREGTASLYYKQPKQWVTAISYRLEKYGMYAYQFFYLPDRRPFFAIMRYSGIIENDKFFSDPTELGALYDKLASLQQP